MKVLAQIGLFGVSFHHAHLVCIDSYRESKD
jgi:hypothetical protein